MQNQSPYISYLVVYPDKRNVRVMFCRRGESPELKPGETCLEIEPLDEPPRYIGQYVRVVTATWIALTKIK